MSEIKTSNKESQEYFSTLDKEEQEKLLQNQDEFLKLAFEYAIPVLNFEQFCGLATSLYRCPASNDKEGGSKKSKHLAALAGDWPAGIFPKLKGGTREQFKKITALAWYHFNGRNTGLSYIHLELRRNV